MANEPGLVQPDARPKGRYVLGELLGRGGMGEVFAGYAYGSHGFQKPVAIKRILPELANDETFVERLIAEAKLLVGIQHSNIVSVLDLAREGDDVFLVMEFVDGPSLYQLLKARGERGLSFGIAGYIIQSAAAGLHYAHARPGGAIIHADISPGNILLSTSGEVRVADFGIAQREGGAGGVEGKWAYMAPEQLRGEPLTQRCDVFALGIVLYELLTGRHPFGLYVTHEERLAGPHRIIPPRIANDAVPPGLEALCLRALAEDPGDRIATMQELIDALIDQRFASGWREGASELALAIAEVTAQSQRQPPGTQVTGRPVTIMTASLIGSATKSRTPPTPSPDAEPSQPTSAIELAPTGLFGVPDDLAEPPPAADDEPTAMVAIDAPLPSEPTSVVPPPAPSIARSIAPSGPTVPLYPEDLEPTAPRAAITTLPSPGALDPDAGRVPVHRKSILLLLAAAAAGIVLALVLVRPTRGTEQQAAASPDDTVDAPAAQLAEIDAAVAVAVGAPAPVDAEVAVLAAAPEDADVAVVTPAPVDAADEPEPGTRPKANTAGTQLGRNKQQRSPPPPPPTGWLRVATANGAWAKASLRSETFDIPGASFKLKPGTNKVTVKDASVTRTCNVAFKPGSQTLTVSMTSGKCVVQ